MHIDPRMVNSPKSSVSDLNVIIDEGEGYYAIALLKWNNEYSVGMRWNGGEGGEGGQFKGIGNPQSRGVATWFILPNDIAKLLLTAILNDKKRISDLQASDIKRHIENL